MAQYPFENEVLDLPNVFAVLRIEPRVSLRGSLQVSSREINCKEVKMKTQFLLTSPNWIKPSRKCSDRPIIPNIL